MSSANVTRQSVAIQSEVSSFGYIYLIQHDNYTNKKLCGLHPVVLYDNMKT